MNIGGAMEATMTHLSLPDNADHAERLRRLAESVFSAQGSDACAGLRALVREVATAHNHFLARLAALNDLQRLGIAPEAASLA